MGALQKLQDDRIGIPSQFCQDLLTDPNGTDLSTYFVGGLRRGVGQQILTELGGGPNAVIL